jgi:hypothetical protein
MLHSAAAPTGPEPLSPGPRSAAVALGWLVVLPWLSSLPSQKANIEWLREQRIDPSARYSTEVEAMQPILERLNAELTGRTSRGKVSQ